jgi:hypothetical protein
MGVGGSCVTPSCLATYTGGGGVPGFLLHTRKGETRIFPR